MSAVRSEAGKFSEAFAGFICHVRPDRDVVYVAPEGELDLLTVGEVEQQLHELRDAGFDQFVLDLRELTFIDLAGLRMAERWVAAARRDTFTFDVLTGAPAVQRLLHVLGGRHRLALNGDGERREERGCRT
ncbi:MAG TPA: STAS domain-containing protein [Capillimicrobium sp.]|nr:STAS domain-containing protein [Capillimicrobium sp.]